jgi:hypothetical protein
LGAAEQGDDHLFVTPLAIAIVAEGDELTVAVGAFKVAAGNIVEHQMTILQVTSGQGALNGALAGEQPIHGRITMLLHIDLTCCAAQLPQGRVFPLVRQRQLAARIDQAPHDHGQAILDPGLLAGVERPVQSQVLGQL